MSRIPPSSMIQLINALFNAGENIGNAINAGQKLNNQKDLLEFNNWIKTQNETHKIDLEAKNAQNTANFTEATDDLNQSIAYLTAHNVTRDLYADKVLEKYRTKDMSELLESQGIEITDDLEVRLADVNGLADKMNRYTNATKYMNEINDTLNMMETNIMGLNKELENVALDSGYKGLLDLQDINAHIDKEENASLFKEPIYLMDPDNPSQPLIDASGNKTLIGYNPGADNYLARAFRSTEREDKTGKVGFVPKYSQWQVDDAVQPDLEKINLDAFFAEFGGLYDKIGVSEGDIDDPDYEWLKNNGIDEILAWSKGPSAQWDDPEAVARIRLSIEKKILTMLNDGTTYDIYDVPDAQKDIREKVGLTPQKVLNADGQLVDGDGLTVFTDPKLMNQAVRFLYSRWIGDGTIHKNIDTGQRMLIPNPRLTGTDGAGGASGLFSQKYADDGMYLTDYVPGGGYGTDNRDLMFYKMIEMWNVMDRLNTYNINQSLDLLNND